MTSGRVHYLDWLRCGAVLAVVIFHALLPFGSIQPWVIQNAERSDVLALLSALLPFAFPVFFFLAGASARYALRARSLRAFLAERAGRLVVPFAVGTLLLTPITALVIATANGTSSSSFAAFLVAYPGGVIDYIAANVGVSPAALQTIGMHLWFLAWLFLWCLLATPIVVWLSTTTGQSFVDSLARHAHIPGASLAFGLPLMLVSLPLFRISSTSGWDWAVFGLWGGTFVVGYLIFAEERLLAAVRRDLIPALAAAIVGIGGLAATGFTDSIFRGGAHTADVTYVFVVALHALSVWGVTLSVVSAAMRLPFMQRPLPQRANEWTLPIYLLHYPIVIALTALVVQLPLGFWPKVVVNVGLGLAATLIVVAFAVRVAPLRPILGLRQPPAMRRPSVASP
jgi:peptidoglycan/LPS O-acetylase OafA/YrhL